MAWMPQSLRCLWSRRFSRWRAIWAWRWSLPASRGRGSTLFCAPFTRVLCKAICSPGLSPPARLRNCFAPPAVTRSRPQRRLRRCPDLLPASRITSGQLALRVDTLRVHERTQGLGDHHAAVALLVVLHDRYPGAPDRQPAAVDGVDEIGL